MEQKLSGSHKALVEMQDVVAELLRTVPQEYPATKVSGRQGEGHAVQCPPGTLRGVHPSLSPFHGEASPPLHPPFIALGLWERFLKIMLLFILKVIQTVRIKKIERENGDSCRNKGRSAPGPWGCSGNWGGGVFSPALFWGLSVLSTRLLPRS